MPFYPNSSLLTENNTRNIKHMTVHTLCKCLFSDKLLVYCRECLTVCTVNLVFLQGPCHILGML
jgi:hypothetical protein